MHLNVPFHPVVTTPTSGICHLTLRWWHNRNIKFSQSYSTFTLPAARLPDLLVWYQSPTPKEYLISHWLQFPSAFSEHQSHTRNIAYKNHVSALETLQANTGRGKPKILGPLSKVSWLANSLWFTTLKIHVRCSSCQGDLDSFNSKLLLTCPSSWTQPRHPLSLSKPCLFFEAQLQFHLLL